MNSNDAASDHDRLELTPTGFKLTDGDGNLNGSNDKIVYIAIRRPDPLVGKPPAAGVNAFAMDVGNSQSIVPNFNSSFPVAFGFYREFTTTHDWYTGGRLAGATYWRTDASNAASAMTGMDYDTNVGWTRSSGGSALQAWMWKRGPGFDLVTYTGGGSGDIIPHNLNAVPEMMWVRTLSNSNSTTPMKVWSNAFTSTTYTDWNSNRNAMATTNDAIASESSSSFGYGYNAPYTSGDTLNTSRQFFLGGDNDIIRSGYKSIPL